MSLDSPRPTDFVARVYSGLGATLIVPVSVTIWLVVYSVQVLTPIDANRNAAPAFVISSESPTQTAGENFRASVINALIVVAVVTVVTFLIVVLYKCGCERILIVWFGLTAALTYYFLLWTWFDLICTRYQIPYDFITMGLLMWNVGTVGILSTFYYSHPRVQQVYLVVLSVVTAWIFTRLPEWTTWVLLVAVAIYDILAVLSPCGPLKLLIAAAQERQAPIPGFIYDTAGEGTIVEHREEVAPSQWAEARTNSDGAARATQEPPDDVAMSTTEVTLPHAVGEASNPPAPTDEESQPTTEDSDDEDPFAEAQNARPFKLGLGDFIFYSLLVGRASIYSYFTWLTSYIVVMEGMIGTLASLMFLRGILPALPALPISIFLGVAMFFIARYASSPYYYFAATYGVVP